MLQMVPVVVASPEGVKVSTFALLDSGSQTSLILENFADAISLVGEDSPLQLGTINSTGNPVRSRKVSFHVGATGGSEASAQIAMEEAWTVPQLNLPPQKVTRAIMQDFPHLNNLSIPEVNSEDVTVLLGANVLEAILQHDVRRGRPGQLVAILTAFGWTLAGSVNSCLMAIRRMVARRGQPAHIWSDNGTNFVGAKKELREAVKRLDGERIGHQLSADGVQWHFKPLSSPHFGGVWERLVQSAKRALKALAESSA